MITEILESSLPEQLIILIIAAIPVVEIRGSLPIAMEIFNMPWYQSFLLSIIGNLIPVPFILLLLKSVFRLFSKTSIGKAFMEWIFDRTTRRTGIIARYKRIGLIMFVAIPLPFTGAWTAAIAANLLGIGFRQALFYITVGVLAAGGIVTGLIYLRWVGAVVAGVGILAILLVSYWKRRFANNGAVKNNST